MIVRIQLATAEQCMIHRQRDIDAGGVQRSNRGELDDRLTGELTACLPETDRVGTGGREGEEEDDEGSSPRRARNVGNLRWCAKRGGMSWRSRAGPVTGEGRGARKRREGRGERGGVRWIRSLVGSEIAS